MLAEIRLQVGDDTLKQKQLIEAVAAQYSRSKKTESAEQELRAEVAELVLASVIDMLRVVSSQSQGQGRKAGRLPHQLKISNQSIQAAVVNQVPAGKVAAMSRVLNTNRDQMRVAQSIYDQFKSGEMKVPYVAETTKCNEYPADYAKCVADMWIAGTRASEKNPMRSEIPKTRKTQPCTEKGF